MPALNGQVVSTITNAAGAAVCVSWFYDPATRALRNNPAPWTSPDGTVWPAGSGALIAANQTGRQVGVTINALSGGTRQVRLNAGGRAFTAAQLAAISPPNGPFTTLDDFNGLSFDMS